MCCKGRNHDGRCASFQLYPGLTTTARVSQYGASTERDAKVPDYGPFSRRETVIQTPELAKEQVATGEVWGLTPNNGGMEPTVQAYAGRLRPPHKRGIEFATDIAPHPNGSPLEVRWYMTKTPGVQKRYKDGKEFACITAVVTNLQP